MVRTEFGNLFTRLLRGGVRLTPLEAALLRRLVDELPANLQTTVEVQFAAYNLAQREVDGRAVNFYPSRQARRTMPTLAMSRGKSPLVRIGFSLPNDGEEPHAVLTAVAGRAFCISFDADLRPFANAPFTVDRVTQAWRSNF
jgi:hypothetical protein